MKNFAACNATTTTPAEPLIASHIGLQHGRRSLLRERERDCVRESE